MARLVLISACVLVLGGGVYALTMRSAGDDKSVALAEALAAHTRAIHTAVTEECAESRRKLKEWRKLRDADTPSPLDTRQARKMLRQLLKEGCPGQA